MAQGSGPGAPPPHWLIVEWRNGTKRRAGGGAPARYGYGFISHEDLLCDDPDDLHTGKVVMANIEGNSRRANVVMVSADKGFLEKEFAQLTGSCPPPPANKIEQHYDESGEVYSDEAEYFGSNSEWGSSYHPTDESDSEKRHSKKRFVNKKCKSQAHKMKRKRKSSKKNELNDSVSYYEAEKSMMDLNGVPGYSDDVYAFNPMNNPPALVPPYQSVTSYQQCKNTPPMTFDQQTQTAIEFGDLKHIGVMHSNQEAMRMEINQLQATVGILRLKMDSMCKTIDDLKFSLHEKRANVPLETLGDANATVHNDSELSKDNSRILKDSSNVEQNHSRYSIATDSASNSPVQDIKVAECSDMIPIGSGKTLIPRHIYNQIQWGSYTQATRKLLMAVFPRITLATHSLTGKSSPAFKMPAKMQLDSKKVSDIIITVSQLCRVPETLVRSVITIKCSDENKMYKMRQSKLKVKKSSKWNQENNMKENDEDEDDDNDQ